MKILVGIVSSKFSGEIVNQSLAWCSRAGYDLRLFIPTEKELSQYQKAIEDANLEHYLALTYDQIVIGQDPTEYARANGYDLFVTVPKQLERWSNEDGIDGTVLHFATDIGKLRQEFGQLKSLNRHRFENGATIVRL